MAIPLPRDADSDLPITSDALDANARSVVSQLRNMCRDGWTQQAHDAVLQDIESLKRGLALFRQLGVDVTAVAQAVATLEGDLADELRVNKAIAEQSADAEQRPFISPEISLGTAEKLYGETVLPFLRNTVAAAADVTIDPSALELRLLTMETAIYAEATRQSPEFTRNMGRAFVKDVGRSERRVKSAGGAWESVDELVTGDSTALETRITQAQSLFTAKFNTEVAQILLASGHQGAMVPVLHILDDHLPLSDPTFPRAPNGVLYIDFEPKDGTDPVVYELNVFYPIYGLSTYIRTDAGYSQDGYFMPIMCNMTLDVTPEGGNYKVTVQTCTQKLFSKTLEGLDNIVTLKAEVDDVTVCAHAIKRLQGNHAAMLGAGAAPHVIHELLGQHVRDLVRTIPQEQHAALRAGYLQVLTGLSSDPFSQDMSSEHSRDFTVNFGLELCKQGVLSYQDFGKALGGVLQATVNSAAEFGPRHAKALTTGFASTLQGATTAKIATMAANNKPQLQAAIHTFTASLAQADSKQHSFGSRVHAGWSRLSHLRNPSKAGQAVARTEKLTAIDMAQKAVNTLQTTLAKTDDPKAIAQCWEKFWQIYDQLVDANTAADLRNGKKPDDPPRAVAIILNAIPEKVAPQGWQPINLALDGLGDYDLLEDADRSSSARSSTDSDESSDTDTLSPSTTTPPTRRKGK